jgi:hypothetical protein
MLFFGKLKREFPGTYRQIDYDIMKKGKALEADQLFTEQFTQ